MESSRAICRSPFTRGCKSTSMTRPPVFGMISMLAPATEQGATMGVAQGVGSMARIIGPIFAASLFVRNAPLPYLICAVLCFLTSLIAMQNLTHIVPAPPPPAAPVSA